jgi:hypothetical protein
MCDKEIPRNTVVGNTVMQKTIPLQVFIGPEGSRSLRLSDFNKIGT